LVNPTPAQRQQYESEKKRVQEIAKADVNDVYADIGNQLGALMDAYDAISKAFLKEQLDAKKVYRGDESVGRRALKRILITTRLDAMLAEIREVMVFQTPPELGSLYHKWHEAWQQIVEEQETAHAEEIRLAQIAAWQRRRKMQELKAKAAWGLAVGLVILWAVGLMWLTNKSATMRTYLGH
jgi:hypothetical protein